MDFLLEVIRHFSAVALATIFVLALVAVYFIGLICMHRAGRGDGDDPPPTEDVPIVPRW